METATLQKRKLFDGVRGGAICLVVLGHIIQTFYSADFDSNICFRIIYSFHMPLFMFVSGALVYNPERPINFNWVKKKFKMLVIPFILWIPIAYIIAKQYTWISFEDRIIQVIESPDNAMWFLWVLFLLHVLMFFLLSVERVIKRFWEYKIAKKYPSLIVEFCLFILVKAVLFPMLFSHIRILGIGLCARYFNFYFWGYMCNKYNLITRVCESKKKLLVICCFFVSVMFWQRVSPTFIAQEWLEANVKNLHIVHAFDIIYKYFVPYFGIFSTFIVVTILPDIVKKILEYIGKHTLSIYAIHVFIMRRYFSHSIGLSIIAAFTLGLLIPIIIEKVSEWIGVSGILFGKYGHFLFKDKWIDYKKKNCCSSGVCRKKEE